MPRKFVYAPGLPGYGTRGVDGSAGLVGLATYFSAYDGNTDSVTIKSKIIANKELFSNDELIPGYPGRVYQNGDIFIDKNARIFQIDFTEANLYKDTGIFLNTSGFFTSGPIQSNSPNFERYSNAWDSEKFLIDTVYTNSVGDYTQYPTTIYGIKPRYFANVKYIGSDIMSDFELGDYYPFQVWTIGSVDSKDAIALAREESQNVWHFGNADLGVTRDVSLYLDFGDIYSDGVYHGAVSTTNLLVPGWVNIGGDTSVGGDLFTDGDLTINGLLHGPVNIDGTLNAIKGVFTGEVSIYGDLFIEGGYDIIMGEVGSQNRITSGNPLYINTINRSDGVASSAIDIRTGTTSGVLGGGTGALNLYTGNAADDNSGVPGSGGNITLDAGNGGDYGDISTIYGGTGGDITLNTGLGGNSTYRGNYGGRWNVTLGNGGDSLNGDGGTGGYTRIHTGKGGDAVSSSNGGDGGYFELNADFEDGQGGTANGSGGGPGTGGLGGYISISTGRGGHGIGTSPGNKSGDLTLQCGRGGNSIFSSPGDTGNILIFANGAGDSNGTQVNDGGKGGNVTVWGGLGGGGANNGSSNGGDGGHVMISAGWGGDPRLGGGSYGNGGDVSIYGGGWPSSNGGAVRISGGQGTAGTGGAVIIKGGLGTTYGGNIILDPGPGSTSGEIYLPGVTTGIGTGGRYALQIDAIGLISAQGTGTSDIRLKNIDSSISNVMSSISQLSAIKFHYNELAKEIISADTSIADLGLIAQEVAPLFPEIVNGFEREGSIYYDINYIKFVPIFVEAFKEHQIQITDLESNVSSLKNENLSLTNDVSTLLYVVDNLLTRVEALEASIG